MAEPLPPDVVDHLGSLSLQSQEQAAATTPANAIIMDQTGSTPATPPPSNAALDLPPDVVKHLASMSSLPDAGALTDPFNQPVRDNTPDGPPLVDKYKDMGDWFLAPEMWKHLKSYPAILGAINADRDSVEGIVKKNFPESEVKHDDGNLVIRYSKKGPEYVFRTGQPQISDFLRAGMGAVPNALIGAGATAAGATVGAPIAAGILGTGLGTHALGALRGYAGGAPASYLEDMGAMVLHGVIHGAGTLAGTIANQGTVAPGLRAVIPPEGPALLPAGAAAGGAGAPVVGTSVPEVPTSAVGGAPVGIPAEPPPGSVPALGDTPGAVGTAPPPPTSNPLVKELADRADETIRGVTRELDRSKMNSRVLGYHTGEVERFKSTAEAGYKAVDKGMAGRNARTEDVLRFIDKIAETLKDGHADLPTWVQKIYDNLSPVRGEAGVEYPTYHNLDMERRAVGAKLDNLVGPNPDYGIDKGIAKGLYEAMSGAQEKSIPDKVLAATYEASRAAKVLQYETQDKITELFGKQMKNVFEGDLGPKLENSIRPLSDGASTAFRNMASALPPQMRSDAIMSSISNMFGNVGAGEPLQLGKFENWFRRTMSNEVSKRTLTDNLNSDAMQGLRDLYSITQKIRGIGAEAAERKLAKEGELEVAKESLAAAQQEFKDARATAIRLAKRALKNVERLAKAEDPEVIEAAARMKTADRLVREANKHVARAEVAARQAAARPGIAQKVASFGSDAASYHGENLGIGARVTNRVLSIVPDVKASITSSLAFRRLAKAYNLPTPRMIDLLRRSIAASSAGVPGRLGAPGKPNDSDLVRIGAQ